MALLTEVIEEKQKILIASKSSHDFVGELKKELAKYGAEVYVAPHIIDHLEQFDLCFVINDKRFLDDLHSYTFKKLIYISFGKKADISLHESVRKTKRIKLIHIVGNKVQKQDYDRILWFIFSQSEESELTLYVAHHKEKSSTKKSLQFPSMFRALPSFSFKKIILVGIGIIALLHFAFVPYLLSTSLSFYQSFQYLKNEQLEKANEKKNEGKKTLTTAKMLYQYSRPTFLLFSLALPIDSLFNANETTYTTLDLSSQLYTDGQQLIESILQKNKTPQEIKKTKTKLDSVRQKTVKINDALLLLNQQLPFPQTEPIKKLKQNIAKTNETITKIKTILPLTDELLGGKGRKKYLLLFANNMELRPGGGFIGSFGVVDTYDYTIGNIQIYDVYDADGQLNVHIDPPDAIRKYLQQPHYFLRDSAFSPDFTENTVRAQSFLDQEMKFGEFDGFFLITTTAIQNILGAYGTVYLPDFDEKVNQSNFYLKAQVHSESGFFPGSTQKKNFLSSLARYIFLHTESVSVKKLAQELKKSFDEKQIVATFKNDNAKRILDTLYWSGRVIEPQCANAPNCISDYLFPYDANLGVNKANFFIKRSMTLSTDIKNNGSINHVLSLLYRNESLGEIFPGGSYKNYFQVLLPQNAVIESITKNGTLVEEWDEEVNQFKKIGFYFVVAPKETQKIDVRYHLSSSFQKGKGLYQLVVQKQIGSANNDIALSTKTAPNISILSQNFSPLVKDERFVYNTVLTSDKIFFIDLIYN